MGREDAGVQLHVSGLIHSVNVSEGSGDAEVRGDGPQRLLYSPDLSPKTARTETTNVYSRLATKKKTRHFTFRRCATVAAETQSAQTKQVEHGGGR